MREVIYSVSCLDPGSHNRASWIRMHPGGWNYDRQRNENIGENDEKMCPL